MFFLGVNLEVAFNVEQLPAECAAVGFIVLNVLFAIVLSSISERIESF